MPGATKYFLDSYAIINILLGSREYAEIKLSEGLTTLVNLMEVQYFLHKQGVDEEEIHETLSQLLPACVNFSFNECFDAVKFRYKNSGKRLSYVDCLGYTIAKKRRVLFVTGDKEFKELPNVMFLRG
ncbi:MAG: PIN domain-containing protein [Candidatus Altiarchaeota archaeon]|nr:PIN domain-containing protein [Candidatus Altiarchaeota archaeon]